MQKKLTFLIISDNGGSVRTVGISKAVLFWTALSFSLLVVFLIYFSIDYNALRAELFQSKMLTSNMEKQEQTIASQQAQIQFFDSKIDKLQSYLKDLKSLEKKIRLIANLDGTKETTPFFGIGGSSQEDRDPGISIQKDHAKLTKLMHRKVDRIASVSMDRMNSFNELLHLLEDKKNLLAATPSIKPVVGRRTSKFGYRKAPFSGRREFHKGLDLAAGKGSHIKATANGTVVFSGKNGTMGNMITIDHGYGMITRYGHADVLLVKKGDVVHRGDIIALVGNTGRSTGPHLHYEVRLNGIAVNPENYF